MNNAILPEDFGLLSAWEPGCPVPDTAEARSAEAVLAAWEKTDIYFTAPHKSESDLYRVIGKCRIVADSMAELRWANCAAQERIGTLEPAGIRLVPDGWDGPGIQTGELTALLPEIRKLRFLTIRGCFMEGDTAGLHGAALGRYYRNCFETAKRLSAVLPCKITFLCIVKGGEAAVRNAQEYPETLPEFQRAAEIVAAQNRSAFYARLLVT